MLSLQKNIMNNQFSVKWSLTVKIITVVFALFLTLVEIKLLKSIFAGNLYWHIIVIAGIIFIALLSILLTPRYIQLNDDCFILKKLIGKKIIDLQNIVNIEPFCKSMDIQICGNGGYGGYFGVFSNVKIGKYFGYVGDFSQAFLIQLKNGKNYVFSCENRDFVIETIKNKIL